MPRPLAALVRVRRALSRVLRSVRFAVAAAIAASLLAGGGAARAADDDLRLWSGVTATAPVAENLTAGLLVQTRFSQDVDELERVLVRPWLGTRVGVFDLAIGYDAHVIEHPRKTTEHRIWPEAAFRHPLGGFGVAHRLRLESRLLEGVSGASVRVRYLLGLTRALGASPVSVRVANEVFLGLNEKRNGPPRGFDENRTFVGLGVAVAPGWRVEGGYQLQYIDFRGRRDAANHTLVLGLAYAH